MPETIDANTGQVIQPTPPSARPFPLTIPSIINIPPQVATTVFWVAVGFGLCWWLMGMSSSRRSMFD